MVIPQNIRNAWKLLKEHGDVTALAEYVGVSKMTIAKALNKGECSEDVFKKISAFYRDRKSLLKWE